VRDVCGARTNKTSLWAASVACDTAIRLEEEKSGVVGLTSVSSDGEEEFA
jgi:hypothetical protein